MFACAAACDVTPKGRPVRLAGYAGRHAPTAKVSDPIEISALLLECDGRRCLLLSFDLMMVGSELERLILSRLAGLGFRADEVLLLASHTHTAPATDQACVQVGVPDAQFIGDAANAVEALVRRVQREPAAEVSIDIFRGRLNHAINRRRYWPYPTFGRTYGFKLHSVVFSPNPSGPKDEDATVIVLRKIGDGKPLAALWHYACHPTAVVPTDVISADYPGAVRAMLRARFGEIPCLFAQGFCGDLRPNVVPSPRKLGVKEHLARIVRVAASGNLFPNVTAADWIAWSRSLAAAVGNIVEGSPVTAFSPHSLGLGSASMPIDRFFTGSIPDKELTARIVEIGDALEIVALSAEVTVEWQRILDSVVPRAPQRMRLYTGYLGAVYGYLPTAAQVREGGYEVQGFQPLFGMSGRFEPGRIEPAVATCVKSAFDDMERGSSRDRANSAIGTKSG
jgi:hypothetical protein